MKVEIITKQGKNARGFVEDVATKASYYGVVVRLKSGEIGNVKKILLSEEEMNKKDSLEIKKMIEKGENFYIEFKSSALWSANYSENEIRQSKSFDLHCFKQKTSKVIIAKSIAALLNSGGGSLVIGIKERKENHGKLDIIGINDELKKLKDRENNKDGYKRMIIDDVIRSFFPPKIYNHLNDYIWISFVEIDVPDADNNKIINKINNENVIDGDEKIVESKEDNDERSVEQHENNPANKKTICWIKIRKCDVKVFLKINDKEIFMIRTDTENRALEGERLVDYCVKRFG